MKSEILILYFLCISLSSFAQPDSSLRIADTAAHVGLSKKVATPSSLQDFDELMIAPPQKLYLPLRPQSMPLSLYGSYSTYELGAKAPEDNQNKSLDNFYLNYNASRERMFEHNKAWDIVGISASAFVWGMVVKQAIDGKPNPNVKPAPPKLQAPKPIN